MKKRITRLAAMGMAAVMTAALLSGCSGRTKATPENLPQRHDIQSGKSGICCDECKIQC